jgi:hypothetical protein
MIGNDPGEKGGRTVKLVMTAILSLALAGAASAQTTPPSAPGPLDRTQQVGAWTVSDLGSKPGDDSEREVKLARSTEDVEVSLYRTDRDGAGLTTKFSRCDGLNASSGFSVKGDLAARAAQVKGEIHDAFKDFAKLCPPKAGEEAALLEGFDAADSLLETWVRDRPFTYPPEPDAPKPKHRAK